VRAFLAAWSTVLRLIPLSWSGWMDEALKPFMRIPAVEVPKVTVQIVDGITGICPKCHAEIPDYVPPPEPSRLPPTIDVEPMPATGEEAKDAKPAEPKPKA
jgi:hypothetical protein